MEKLESLRMQIDEIDRDIVKLLEDRFKVCLSIGRFKKENGMEVLNESREKQVVEKNIALVKDDFYREFIEEVLKTIMAESRKIQEEI
ncbi:MAG: chorismate mutase [Bacillota bacterium]|nr:chorismate mutase [Bacillota bacterium]